MNEVLMQWADIFTPWNEYVRCFDAPIRLDREGLVHILLDHAAFPREPWREWIDPAVLQASIAWARETRRGPLPAEVQEFISAFGSALRVASARPQAITHDEVRRQGKNQTTHCVRLVLDPGLLAILRWQRHSRTWRVATAFYPSDVCARHLRRRRWSNLICHCIERCFPGAPDFERDIEEAGHERIERRYRAWDPQYFGRNPDTGRLESAYVFWHPPGS